MTLLTQIINNKTNSGSSTNASHYSKFANKDTLYLHLLRIIGCILVTGVHVSAFNLEDLAFPSGGIFIANAYNHIALLGVPLFVMISGCIMLSPDYRISYQKLLTQKVPKLILVYFFSLIFYNLMNCYQEGYGYSFASIKEHVILNSLLGKGIYHLWFLPMMIGLYLITPILRKITDDKKLCFYCLLLYFISVILFPTLLKFNFRFKTIVESLYNRIPYRMLTGYIGYYLLGYYLHHYVPALTKRNKLLAALTGILFCIAGFSISYVRALGFGVFSQILNDPFSITDFISVGCLFLLIKEMNGQLKQSEKLSLKLNYFSSLTMGIYLVHPAILMIAGWFHLDTLFLPQIISIPVCILVVTALSAGITALLKLIPGVRAII